MENGEKDSKLISSHYVIPLFLPKTVRKIKFNIAQYH